MSLTAQEVVERAGVELSKCITGLGLRSRSRDRELQGGGGGGGEGSGRMGSVRRGGGGVMEKVANVLCGNSVAAAGLANGKARLDKPLPPDKPTRFLLGKARNGGPAAAGAGPPGAASGTSGALAPLNGHQGGSPRPLRAAPRSPAHLVPRHRYLSWEELVRDEAFLARFFLYFSPLERRVLAQVSARWRGVLYQPRFWHGLRPVLHCRELRSATVEATTDMRRRFYVSVQQRGFDSLVLLCANDEDLMDLVANYAVNHTKALRSVALRCSNVSDKGLETLLDHLNGVYQLELQGCNDVTEAGLWACLNPRIVSLSVADCINVADEAVGAIAQLLPSLYELNLQAYHVTDAALAFFSPRQTSTLSILRLHSCWELTNHAIINIVHSLPNLTVLSLSGCSKITDDGVELIAENLRRLRSLDLSWCPRITDAALEYIACDLNQLEELTLDRCVHVTDIGVGYVSTMLSLSALFLRWCSQVRDFGVQHLCSMRNIQVLSLAGCSLVTSAGLSSLVQLRHLQELELTNCPGATPELYHHLHLHLPKCLIIE
ncbi:F-box/LRR-repeat protein 16-like [Eriocheir sinensis]|uniref:F-box/LRR-repeat protein 16-like n=1 Tax=Eriocheir sinensis TaxID=95602 RepID=UPI0021C70F0E|nr:F-box/LRR-repeat protein 16-like [Eriocheir sinensis]